MFDHMQDRPRSERVGPDGYTDAERDAVDTFFAIEQDATDVERVIRRKNALGAGIVDTRDETGSLSEDEERDRADGCR